MLILMTQAEADAVRGTTTPLDALNPVGLSDGTFILGVEVLDDPAHADQHALLATFPQVTEESVAHLMKTQP